jgi:hypothetical protein
MVCTKVGLSGLPTAWRHLPLPSASPAIALTNRLPLPSASPAIALTNRSVLTVLLYLANLRQLQD